MGCSDSKEEHRQEKRDVERVAAVAMESVGKLTYFGIHGRAGPIRLLLSHKGLKFDDVRIAQEDWPAMKPTTPGGSLPLWQPKGSEMIYTQTKAIMKYLGTKYGYMPRTEHEWFRMEYVNELYADWMGKKQIEAGMGQPDAEAVEAWRANNECLFGSIEKMLEASDLTIHLACDKMTVCDFFVFSGISSYIKNPLANDALKVSMVDELEKYPKLKSWSERMFKENKAFIDSRPPAPV